MLLWGGSLALFWPGVAMYDSVAQYGQASSGRYDDWHPPVMARLWSLFGANGAAPMLAVQMTLYWAGFGLIAAALAGEGRRRAACATLAIGAFPLLLGWQAVVLKDTQMLAALLGATGIAAWWRLRGERTPVAMALLAAVLVGYATLVRANAVFATVPLAVGLIDRGRPTVRISAAVGAVAAVLILAPFVNHRVMRAEASGVERTEALYDLAGIAVRRSAGERGGLTVAEAREIGRRHCWSPFFWDPLGDAAHCGTTMARLSARPPGELYATLMRAIVHHPLGYARARLSSLNATERWLVPAGWPGAVPPVESEPNTLALGSPGPGAARWREVAAITAASPLGWPIAWVAVAVTALVAVGRRRDPAARLSLALFGSALALEASFTVFGIASDLRYHLWPMTATALGVTVAAREGRARRVPAIGAAVLLVMVASGSAARLLLPAPPTTYQGMLDWADAGAISF